MKLFKVFTALLCPVLFFICIVGDMKRAEDHFRAVHDRATKGSTALLKQKYLFGSLLGLVGNILLDNLVPQ
jgi:hypothetical protein